MILSVKKKLITLSAVLAAATIYAQEAAPAASTPASSSSTVLYLLLAIAAVLLVVVMMLGNVLVSLTRMLAEKGGRTISTVLLLLVSSVLFAQDPANAVNNPPAAPTAGTSMIFGDWNVVIGASVVLIEIFAVILLALKIRGLLNELYPQPEEASSFTFNMPNFWDKVNASVAIEHEKDVLLDHNYDGIQELDNNLPPWWKYGFYVTIIWAFGYMAYYHVMGGPSSEKEFEREMAQAKIEVEEYMRANAGKVDESNVTLADASGLAEGKQLFTANCAACHGNVGEGNAVGPNLTDQYWLHGGSLVDVFKSVKYGWPAKGMKSWQQDLTPVQIKNVASYIQSIQGSNPPNAKAPQGELYTASGNAPAAADSAASVKDSTATAVK